MDPFLYKNITVSRGFEYHYLSAQPQQTKPVLLLLHGFPSTSFDWRFQVSFFKENGYGLIVPDMLGYGGTSKPTDVEAYRPSLICKDIIDILDAEDVQQCIVIGHDWGSKITSRLANLYSDRFISFAFLAVPYILPRPNFNVDEILALTKQTVGYELIGYWKFFSEEGADKLVEEHWESFFSALFPEDPKLWVTTVGPVGALKSWVESGQKAPLANWLSEQERNAHSDILRKGGLAAPFCWYKVMTSGINADDDSRIAPDTYVLHKPVFFGAAKQDYVSLAAMGKAQTAQFCKDATIREFDASHWLIMEKKDEVNNELLAWIEGAKRSE